MKKRGLSRLFRAEEDRFSRLWNDETVSPPGGFVVTELDLIPLQRFVADDEFQLRLGLLFSNRSGGHRITEQISKATSSQMTV